MTGITAYVASRKYVEDTAISLGAVKGANCTISNIIETEDTNEVVFKWTGTDGTVQTRKMIVKNGTDGEDGISIAKVEIDPVTNRLTCTLSDGSIEDCGTVNVKTNVDSIAYSNTEEPEVLNVKMALDKLFAEGGGVLEEEINPNINIGSVKSNYPVGTPLETIIRDMLQEKIAPTLNVSFNPSKTLYDIVSEKITSLTINAIVGKKTNSIDKVEFYVNNTLVHTNTNCANGGTVPYIYNTEIKDTVTIKVVVTDNEGLSTTQSKTITFVGRSYYGYIEPDVEVSEAVIKTLQHNVLQNTKALTYNGITCTYHRIVYCYDKAFGELSTIIDPINNFSYNNSFEKKTIIVDGIEKLCYVLIQATGADDVTIRFS